ncbi:MAG TPA: hypothetical protein VN764_02050 [Polyangiaceae bacterium]|nr:hypothetical protein [Polyangiaceae bacterium]
MKARAPGKLVISGAYAVLRGAPAVVTAVDRYVIADDGLVANFETPEVEAALRLLGIAGPHPWFSADALRQDGRKLGLGSSAAICAASVALLHTRALPSLPPDLNSRLGQSIYELTLSAHRAAQGGGSGVDVAAACFGGTLEARLDQADGKFQLQVSPVTLPKDLVIETWSAPLSATTADFVRRVFALERSAEATFTDLLGAQIEASRAAHAALLQGSSAHFVAALRRQLSALEALGDAAQVTIVLPEHRPLCDSVKEGACFLPSGAGGGDVMLHVSTAPSDRSFRQQAEALGLHLIPLHIGAQGVHILPD